MCSPRAHVLTICARAHVPRRRRVVGQGAPSLQAGTGTLADQGTCRRASLRSRFLPKNSPRYYILAAAAPHNPVSRPSVFPRSPWVRALFFLLLFLFRTSGGGARAETSSIRNQISGLAFPLHSVSSEATRILCVYVGSCSACACAFCIVEFSYGIRSRVELLAKLARVCTGFRVATQIQISKFSEYQNTKHLCAKRHVSLLTSCTIRPTWFCASGQNAQTFRLDARKHFRRNICSVGYHCAVRREAPLSPLLGPRSGAHIC